MSPSPCWRDRFVDLAAELCRALGDTEPLPHTDADQPLRLRLRIQGVDFEAWHEPGPGAQAERFVLHCRFGVPAVAHEERALRQALETNRDLGRWQSGLFGLDDQTQELVLSTHRSLRDADAALLVEAMNELAQVARAWRAANASPRD